MENPNADYDKLMDEKKDTTSFPKIYDNAMNSIAASFDIPESLITLLDQKRNFGLEKYGERAFQSSLENAMTSPAFAHLGDELIDSFNYALHNYYIAMLNVDSNLLDRLRTLIYRLKETAAALYDVKQEIEDQKQVDALEWVEGFSGPEF